MTTSAITALTELTLLTRVHTAIFSNSHAESKAVGGKRATCKRYYSNTDNPGKLDDEPIKLETPPDKPSRPRTRAWVKQEKDKTTKITPNPKIPPLPRKEFLRPGSSQIRSKRDLPQGTLRTSSRPREENSPIVAEAGEPKQPKKSRRQVDTVAAKRPQQRRSAARGQNPETARWLEQIEPVSLGGARQAQTLYTAPVPGVVYESRENMESSSTSRNTKDNESTAKAAGTKSLKVSENKLRLRRVNRDATSDERLAHLKSIVKTQLPERLLRDTEDFQRTLRDFLQLTVDHPNEICYPYIDDFSFKIDEDKSKIDYPIVNNKYFQADLKRCLARNEAVLQRTIMIHIINQYWLGNIFDWNCEGQWSQPKDSRLPSREDDDISLPKPDLAIGFTLKSFTGEDDDSDPIPSDLEKCISPDGGSRCFPFLFMEVKRAASDLQDAYMANLHSASQALYNIYLWMVRAGEAETFFKTVRVFSFVFNAQDLGVRVHRASQLAKGNLAFRFDEFSPLGRYSKDQACLLIKTILTDYAAQELHPVLSVAFAEIVKQEDERVVSKRKNNPPHDVGRSKRVRKGQDATQHTGQSFAIGNLST